MLLRQPTCLCGALLVRQRLAIAAIRSPVAQTFSSSAAISKYIKRPRNEGIPIPIVQLIDDENKIRPPQPLSEILASIKRRTHFVELVQDDPPLVKILDKEKAQAARMASKIRSRTSKMDRKEIQMTWNVGEMDLTHKIMKVREQLEHNNLVDIAFAPKARQKLPSVEAMEEKMQKVVDALQDIAIERQDRTLLKGVGILFLRLDKAKVPEKQ